MGTADTTLTANWVADSLTCSITSSGTTSTVDSSWYVGDVTLNLVITEGNSSVSQKGLASSANSINDLTTLTVTTDTSGTTYYGHVLTSTGKDVSCTKTIKKDATAPTCTITSPTLWDTIMTLNASDNIALAASPYSWTSSSSGFSTTSTKAGTTGTSVYNAWVKDAVGNVGACRLTCGSFAYVGPGYTDGTCNGTGGMNYYSGCVQWTSASQCCTRTGYYRCGVNSGCYTDNRYSRTCTSATVAP